MVKPHAGGLDALPASLRPTDAVLQFKANGELEFANDVATSMLGPVQPESTSQVFIEGRSESLRDLVSIVVRTGICLHTEVEWRRAEAEQGLALDLSIIPFHLQGVIAGAVVAARDNSSRRNAQAVLEWSATHDALTGMLNRAAFMAHLKTAAEGASRGAAATVLFLDLDKFKRVNDLAGHAAGDELLRQVAAVLGRHARQADVFARLGGDEFCALLAHTSVSESCELASRMRDVLSAFRFHWDGAVHSIGASFGVAGLSADDPQGLLTLSRADSACRAAKQQGRGRIEVGAEPGNRITLPRNDAYWSERMVGSLDEQSAIAEFDEIAPLGGNPTRRWKLRPRIRDLDGRLAGFDTFGSGAERHGTVHLLDAWALRTALELLGRTAPGVRVRIHLAVSASSLAHADFIRSCGERLRENPAAARRIAFEISDTAAESQMAMVLSFAESVRAAGAEVFLTGFGIGSALGTLRTMPIDGIELDAELANKLATSHVERAIVRGIRGIASSLNLITLARSCDTGSTVEQLREEGIDYAQGDAFRRKLSSGDVRREFAATTPDPA